MRISTNYIQNQGVRSMAGHQTDVSKTEMQLATGKKINTGADDPAGAAGVAALKQSIAMVGQYGNGINIASSSLGQEENVLASVTDIMQHIRELAVQSGNGVYGESERGAMAMEVEQSLDELLSLANSKNGAGEYIFSGYSVHTKPYETSLSAYEGDPGQKHVKIGHDSQIAVADPGSEIFTKDGANIFVAVNEFITALKEGDVGKIEDIDNSLNHIIQKRAELGGRLNRVEKQESINEGSVLQMKETLSMIEDVDYAEAISRLNQEMLGLQVSQQTFAKVQSMSLFNYLK